MIALWRPEPVVRPHHTAAVSKAPALRVCYRSHCTPWSRSSSRAGYFTLKLPHFVVSAVVVVVAPTVACRR